MDIMSCTAGAWYPFRDPDIEEESRMKLFKSSIDAEVERKAVHKPSEWETSELSLRRMLRSNGCEVQRALLAWKEWVIWRKSLDMDDLTAEDIKYEIASGIAFWKGKDKSGQPTLVLTGRMMDPMTRRGDLKSFKKFMVRMVEYGCCLADELGQETFSILYDRRGLGYEHIDPLLHQLTRITADSLRNFYGPRLGNIYIVHANWFFWGIYKAIIRPFLVVVSSSMRDKVHLLNDEKALLPFFEESEIHLLKIDETRESYEASLSPSLYQSLALNQSQKSTGHDDVMGEGVIIEIESYKRNSHQILR